MIDGIDVQTRTTRGADGTSVAYRIAGARSTALVFIHGWSCDQTYWDDQWAAFADDYTVITVDLAGHGVSGTARSAWTMARFGEDVAAAVADAGADNVILVGHSMGGPVMLEAARRLGSRVRMMVGVDTLKDPNEGISRSDAQALWGTFSTNFAGAVEGFVRGRFFPPDADPALVDQVALDMASAPSDIALAAGIELSVYDRADGLRATTNVPLVLINAAQPPTNASALSDVRDGITVTYMPKTGHFPMREDPGAFERALRAAINAVLP